MRRRLALGLIALGIAACGGTSSDLLGNAGDGGNGDGGGSGNDGGSKKDSANDSGQNSNSDGGDACPDLVGSYSIAKSGDGCGDLATDAAQCVTATGTTCSDLLASLKPDGGLSRGVNGGADIGGDGSFSGASITLGTMGRSGCIGTWDAGSSTLTVECGGATGSQSCIVTLTRTASTCN